MREKRHAARRAARTAVTSRFVVLTGLSGSGKSQAIRALEDLGYFCVDNLPVILLPTLAELTLRAGSEIARAAVVVDVREGKLLSEFPGIFRKLKAQRGLNPVLIFLEASEPALVRRFSETRRPHPLAPDRSAIEGIREERTAMSGIRRMADYVVDTSEMTVHELRHAFTGVASGRAPGTQLVVTVLSFGFKHGIPVDSDLLFDVRFLPNPHFVPALRPHTGRDREVVHYLQGSKATHEFLEHTLNLLKFLIPQYVSEGKSYLTIGIGCTGGRHRSVAIAEALKKGLSGIKDVRVRVRHRDIAHEEAKSVASRKSLVASRKSLVASRKSLVAGRKSLVAGRKSLVAGRKSQVAGRKSLVAGRKSLVAGRQSPVAERKATRERLRAARAADVSAASIKK